MKHLLQKHYATITLHILSALPGTEVCIYFRISVYFTPQIKILYPQSPFRYSQKSVSVHSGPFRSPESPFRYPLKCVSVRFGSQRVGFGTQRVRFGIHESPFRSVSVPRESVSVLRESVSVSTKVRFGPFRSVSVHSGPSRSV